MFHQNPFGSWAEVGQGQSSGLLWSSSPPSIFGALPYPAAPSDTNTSLLVQSLDSLEMLTPSALEAQKVIVDVLLVRLAIILQNPAKRKALQELKDDRAQRLIDFLYWVLLQHLVNPPIAWLRKHTLMVLRELSGASMLYPRWYILKNIIYQSYEGGGGFCDIYKGRQNSLELCLKVVRVPQPSQLEKTLKVYAKEAVLWGQLHHPNIIPFYGIFYLDETQKAICLVSPWMSNSNIVTYLKRNAGVARKPLIRDIGSGLKYLHSEGVIHADLKGLNILVNDFGRACITDFGISTIWSDRTLGFTYMTGGVGARSIRWASPELLEEGSKPSRMSDIWAFGGVCYEILTQKQPFHGCDNEYQIIRLLMTGKSPAQCCGGLASGNLDGVDDNMWKLMNWCWSVKPEARPTCGQILDQFAQEGLVNTESEDEARANFLRESRYLQVALEENSDNKIDMVKIGNILAEL